MSTCVLECNFKEISYTLTEMTPVAYLVMLGAKKMYLWQLSKFLNADKKLFFVATDLCSVKADRPRLHKINIMSLCCACGVINLSGTCNSGWTQVSDTVGRDC